ncbi:MAG: glycosyltransferase family 8 protein [Clostridia bacterium]|nr:glycosyltransferase family 8 protein [Clostridia bacterium]
MNILVTLDRNYLTPLRVMLTSLLMNHAGEPVHLYLAADGLTEEDVLSLERLCALHGAFIHPLKIRDDWFDRAPTVRYYSRAMYYRLLAAQMLPETLDRVLYLDPDMLILQPLHELYNTEMGDHLYAACIHKGLVDLSTPVNKIRLSTYENEGYFNSGMLLMNLPEIRRHVTPEDVFSYVERNRQLLLLPDQDVLNGLYGEYILPLDETLYNYDARHFREYLIASQGVCDLDWVMRHTAILHFCGKHKPWNKAYHGRFGPLYKHYMSIASRTP